MRIGDVKVSTTEQNLGLGHDELKLARGASVDPTDARSVAGFGPDGGTRCTCGADWPIGRPSGDGLSPSTT